MNPPALAARRVAVAAAIVVGVVVWAAGAAAQDPRAATEEMMAQARASYERGRALFQAGQWAEALTAFRDAYAIRPHPVVLLSIASCQERLGELRGAVTSLERYVAESPSAPDRAQVGARIEAMRRRPAHLRVTSDPAGASVRVDGEARAGVTPLEVELTAGVHAVRVELAGRRPYRENVTVEYAEERSIAAVLPPLSTVVTGPGPARHLRLAPPPTGARFRPASWVAGGTAAVAVVSGAVFGLLALTTRADYDDEPSRALFDRGAHLALAADLSFGIAATAALAMLLTLAEPD